MAHQDSMEGLEPSIEAVDLELDSSEREGQQLECEVQVRTLLAAPAVTDGRFVQLNQPRTGLLDAAATLCFWMCIIVF